MTDVNDPQVAKFEQHLRKIAPDRFPELAQDDVQVVWRGTQKRPGSTLYSFQLGNTSVRYPVLVKINYRGPSQHEDPADDRPRLAIVSAEEKYALEYKALAAIDKHFSALGDPRFGTIRLLDVLPDARAIIMMKSNDPDLRRLFLRRNRLLNPFYKDKLDTVFENTGAWLRRYHALPLEDHVTVRDATRADFERNTENMANYLADRLGDKPFFTKLLSSLNSAALPDQLPLGRGHGDFSIRNILVSPGHRVTVIDTLAKWQTPIYEDIGYFLVRLQTNQPQVYSQGWAYNPRWIQRCEEAFLRGYFGAEEVPHRIITLFKIQALLDHWAAQVVRRIRRTKPQDALRFRLTNRLFRKIMGELLRTEDS